MGAPLTVMAQISVLIDETDPFGAIASEANNLSFFSTRSPPITESNVVDIYIHYLRNKIDKGFDRKLIRTVRGMGYAIRAD